MQAESLEEALARAEAFAEAGADALFIDALQSEDEMRRFTSLRGLASGVLKMASLLEGGGKTPMVPLATLQRLGFKLVAYPLSLLGVSVAAMQGALRVRRVTLHTQSIRQLPRRTALPAARRRAWLRDSRSRGAHNV